MDCDKCPVRKECSGEKARVVASYQSHYKGVDIKSPLSVSLANFCPLTELLATKIGDFAAEEVTFYRKCIDREKVIKVTKRGE